MKYCKNCNCEINENNIFSSDSRFCHECGVNRKDFIAGRRFVLYSLRSLPLDCKISKTKRMIQDAFDEFDKNKVYISYSGGKDSTVLSHITKQLYPDIVHLFANTTNEYPETIQHVKWEKEENNTNIITVIPIDSKGKVWTFKNVVDYYGYPIFSKRVANAIRTYRNAKTVQTKQNSIDYINRNFKKYDKYKEMNISDKCCDKLKKEPLKRKAKELGLECAIIGILASESRQRESEWLNYGCNVFHIKKDNQCRPLSFWTDKDINEYIEKNDIRISSLYKKGYTRNGCMYCGFGVHLEDCKQNRYQKLKCTHPVQYTYLIKNFEYLLIEFEIAY